MRSATMRWSVACSDPGSTPWTISVDDPTPSMSAPIDDQHLAQVADLGLAGRVVDDRRALGVHGRRQDVLGGADARELERDVGAEQPVGVGLDVAVA